LNKVAKKLLTSSNLSESSLLSEVFSGEVIANKFVNMGYKVKLDETETEIKYIYPCKKTDYTILLQKSKNKIKMAIEVKRLSSFNKRNTIDKDYIDRILTKANKGAIESNKWVTPLHRWDTQILHIITNISDINLVLSYINEWKRQIPECGFSLIIITSITGNSSIIFN